MNQKQRPKFLCWNCDRTFHQTVMIDDDPILLLQCPFCGALARADLDPYRKRSDQILRDGKTGMETHYLRLPEILPTEPRE